MAVTRPTSPPPRSRRLRRLLPLLVLAVGAFAGGLIVGAPPRADRAPARQPLRAGLGARAVRGHVRDAHAPRARPRRRCAAFARAYRRGRDDGDAQAPDRRPRRATRSTTRSRCRSRRARGCSARSTRPVTLPLGEDVGGEPAIEWAPHLVFPGLRRGEELTRETYLPSRGDDPRPRRLAHGLRRGPAVRPRPRGVRDRRPRRPRAARARGGAGGARGARGRAGRHQRPRARVRRPAGRHARRRAAGRARGCWRASRPSAARACARTIDPDIQRAAVRALAGRYGGIAAVRPRTGEVLALAGVAFSAAAAARLGVQDRHADRRRSRRGRSAATRASRSRRRRRSRASSSRTPTASRAAGR